METKQRKRRKDFQDLTGQTFYNLTVLSFAYKHTNGHSMWLCQCTCGNTTIRMSKKMKEGTQQSCGCLEHVNADKIRHGHSINKKTTPEFSAYLNAKSRCTNPNVRNYRSYGGRGIEFRFNSFSEFLEDVGERPSPKHSIDRKDNDGHYEPGNMKWSTAKEQANNRRNNIARRLSQTVAS